MSLLNSDGPEFNWADIPYTDESTVDSFSANFFPISQEKSAPDALAEYINHSSVPAGATIMILDDESGNKINYITNKFFLSSFRMSFSEKAQLTETFGSANVSFFNDTIKVYNFGGRAIDYPSNGDDAAESMQQSSLTRLYNKHLRGTQLVKNDNIALVKVFNHMVYGYPLNFNVTYTAQMDKISSFSFQFVVTKHTQNLPGLISDGDLDKNYSTTNVIFNEQDNYRLGLIKTYEEAYQEHLTLYKDENSTSSLARPFNVTFLSGFTTVEQANNHVNRLFPGISAEQENFKSRIRKGLYSFLSYINNARHSFIGLDSTYFGDQESELLKDVNNGAIDGMFRSQVSFNRVKEFLVGIDQFKSRLQIIKTTIRSGNLK